MKKTRVQDAFFEELRKIPVVQVCCEKVGISRNTVYRWRREDPKFAKAMEKAMEEGEEFVNDMSESQVLTLIKEKNWSAIRFWLTHHHAKYRTRVEVEATLKQEELTPEQEKVVREALKLSATNVNQ